MIFIVFSVLYLLLVIFLIAGFSRLSRPLRNNEYKKISVIVAARNEEKHLPELLNCLNSQNYPKESYEIIIVNDRSTDGTEKILRNKLNSIKNLRTIDISSENPEIAGKKNAILQGINTSSHDLLAFTDADCIPGRNWLREIDRHFDSKIDFIVGYSPLIVIQSKFLSMLKNLERAIFFALAAGSFGWKWGVTCTARNMAYRKSLFLKADGFAGIAHIPSGDDDLLMQKMVPFIRKMTFMLTPDSIVKSYDKIKYSDQIALETRRASKFRYHTFSVKLLSLFILVYFLLQLLLSILLLSGEITLNRFLLLICLRLLPDLVLLHRFLRPLKSEYLLFMLPIYELIYPIFYIFIAAKGTFGKYKWKR